MLDKEQFENILRITTTEVQEKQKGRINAMINPEFVACDAEELTAEIRFPVEYWQLNRGGTLHGGIVATMFDLTFGALTRATVNLDFVPTVELSTTYVRPINLDDKVIVKAKILQSGRKLTHIFGEAFIEGSGKKAAIGKGIFYNENTSK